MPSARNLAFAFALATIAALALAACGGSGTSSNSSPKDGSSASSSSPKDGSSASSSYIVPSKDKISTTKSTPSVAQQPPGQVNDEVNGTGAGPVNPCRLVSRGEAAAILGENVSVTVGQQGPTCIYATQGSKQMVTLVVEQASFTYLRHHAREATPVQVGSRAGWCLRYGSTSVAVPLSSGSVLNVTGPCGVAARFAALALDGIARAG